MANPDLEYLIPDENIRTRIAPYSDFLDEKELIRLAQALETPPLQAIRINTLKISADKAISDWTARYNWQVKNVPFCESALQFTTHERYIGQTLEYKMGQYYIQDAASMLPAEMFSMHDDPLILDMAAAPGGKTTHMASRFHDKGIILANDRSANRLKALRSNLQTWGVIGAAVTGYPGERFGEWFPEQFDRVLVDAPCSGDTLRVTKGSKSRYVSARERRSLTRRQISLLDSAFRACAPGGEIVYSTCTMSPDENEAVLDALLQKYPNSVSINTVNHWKEPIVAPALTADAHQHYHPDMRHAIRLWPHLYKTSGFFAALIHKSESSSTMGQSESIPSRPMTDTEIEPVSTNYRRQISGTLYQSYGFDLDAVLQEYASTLCQRGEVVYAIPKKLLNHFGNLPHLSAGLPVCLQIGGDFIPAHELITRFESQFKQLRITVADDQVTSWLQGHGLRGVENLSRISCPVGAIILLEDSNRRFLGRGKVLKNRIRNMLPKRVIHG